MQTGALTMKIIAHRGAAAEAPENTIEAIERAIELGADAVELDVRVTHDGVPVLIHDADLVRTHGAAKLVADLELSALERIALEREKPVPTLEEVLARFGNGTDFIFDIKDAAATEPTIQHIVSAGCIERAIIACASLRVLGNVRSEMPELRTGFIIGEAAGAGFGFNVSERVIPVIDVVMPYWRLVRHHFAAGCRRYSLPIYAWLALFDEEGAEPRYDIFSQMAAVGVDAVATIRPDALRAHVPARAR